MTTPNGATSSAKAASVEDRLNALIAHTNSDGWHSLGSLSNFTVTRGRYRMSDWGEVEIDVHVVGNGSNSSSTTFANNLPAAYQPGGGATRRFPLESGRNVTAGDPWPRVEIDTSGNVTVVVAASVTAAFSNTFYMPTDA